MHLRLSTVRRGDKTYRYAQLVESFRREDGRPTHRILASLGALDDDAVANLRAALEANRQGAALVVPGKRSGAVVRPVVRANFRYLDLAVLLRIWTESGIGALLADILAASQSEIGADQVITALALHRCVAPGSKLAAWRWFPKTALPELLAVSTGQFNNSRVHRALEALELVDASLQTRLAHVVQRTQGACVRLFIDATDTWFVGHGPPLAARGTDKEGQFRRRVGIVLLCDQRGFPLRWETLSGRYHDPTALLDMAVQAGKLDWVGDKPVVFDRAAGNAGAVQTLLGTGIRFLTALPWSEFVSSGAPIPWEKVAILQTACEAEGASPASIARAGAEAGFDHPREDRFLFDLKTFDKSPPQDADRPSAASVAMRFALRIQGSSGEEMEALAARYRVSVRSAQRHRELLPLREELQLRVLSGHADAVPLQVLRAVARCSEAEQLAAFDSAIALHSGRPGRARSRAPGIEAPILRTRGVLYFNPERFVEKRDLDKKNIERIELAVAELNRRLALRTRGATDGSVLAAAHTRIVRYGLGAVLIPRVERQGTLRVVVLDQDDAAWERRRQADGLALLVAHPELPGTATDLVSLYFEKDIVEKDFQTIKSAIELRPIHHRTDVKLRAHVTVCMLALLLQRILGERLRATAPGVSARAALERLETVHLNQMTSGKAEFYTVTEATQEQRSLLAALAMEDLARDERVAETITAR